MQNTDDVGAHIEIVRKMIRQFTIEFVQDPYLCYTEHGLHARFYAMLYDAIPTEERYLKWDGHRVCVIQKEYPTARNLGKPRRQHWDVAVIKTPPESHPPESPPNVSVSSYDYLRLVTVVEFGMNADEDHLQDDIQRVSHPDANIDHAFLVHLYRLSRPGEQVSKRDLSPNSAEIVSKECVAGLAAPRRVEVTYGLSDSTGKRASGVWEIADGKIACAWPEHSPGRFPVGGDLPERTS